MSKSEEFYEKLYSQLKSTNTWPNFYLFKFIIISNTNNLELIKTIFQNIDLEINTKSSKNNKYLNLILIYLINNKYYAIN